MLRFVNTLASWQGIPGSAVNQLLGGYKNYKRAGKRTHHARPLLIDYSINQRTVTVQVSTKVVAVLRSVHKNSNKPFRTEGPIVVRCRKDTHTAVPPAPYLPRPLPRNSQSSPKKRESEKFHQQAATEKTHLLYHRYVHFS